jgi:hypothetical protein
MQSAALKAKNANTVSDVKVAHGGALATTKGSARRSIVAGRRQDTILANKIARAQAAAREAEAFDRETRAKAQVKALPSPLQVEAMLDDELAWQKLIHEHERGSHAKGGLKLGTSSMLDTHVDGVARSTESDNLVRGDTKLPKLSSELLPRPSLRKRKHESNRPDAKQQLSNLAATVHKLLLLSRQRHKK